MSLLTLIPLCDTSCVQLIYESFTRYLVEHKGYDKDLLDLTPATWDFCFKGLVVDLEDGNLVKLAEDGTVLRATHGTNDLSTEEIIKHYGPKREWKHFNSLSTSFTRSAKYYFYDNYFDLPGALLCGRVVDMLHKRGNEVNSDFWKDMGDQVDQKGQGDHHGLSHLECQGRLEGQKYPLMFDQRDQGRHLHLGSLGDQHGPLNPLDLEHHYDLEFQEDLLLQDETLSSLLPLGSSWAWCTYHTNITFGSHWTCLTLKSSCTLWTSWAHGTRTTWLTSKSCWARLSFLTCGSWGTGGSSASWYSWFTCFANTWHARGSWLPSRTLWTLGANRSRRTWGSILAWFSWCSYTWRPSVIHLFLACQPYQVPQDIQGYQACRLLVCLAYQMGPLVQMDLMGYQGHQGVPLDQVLLLDPLHRGSQLVQVFLRLIVQQVQVFQAYQVDLYDPLLQLHQVHLSPRGCLGYQVFQGHLGCRAYPFGSGLGFLELLVGPSVLCVQYLFRQEVPLVPLVRVHQEDLEDLGALQQLGSKKTASDELFSRLDSAAHPRDTGDQKDGGGGAGRQNDELPIQQTQQELREEVTTDAYGTGRWGWHRDGQQEENGFSKTPHRQREPDGERGDRERREDRPWDWRPGDIAPIIKYDIRAGRASMQQWLKTKIFYYNLHKMDLRVTSVLLVLLALAQATPHYSPKVAKTPYPVKSHEPAHNKDKLLAKL
ncbi:unnamed protein product [Menidia menidia]|uniref:(Atlantic silverside) hypothetical protein n=1 Tax=Menidia menidia TaxID=238744 RepID=A0A8S4BDB1_9TELE|nr:unnamed protein product [Menidia menidia]